MYVCSELLKRPKTRILIADNLQTTRKQLPDEISQEVKDIQSQISNLRCFPLPSKAIPNCQDLSIQSLTYGNTDACGHLQHATEDEKNSRIYTPQILPNMY